ILGGTILSPGASEVDISGVERIERAGPGEIAFAPAPQQEHCLASTRAAAVVVARGGEASRDGGATGAALIEVDDPYRAFMQLVSTFEVRDNGTGGGIHPTAIVPDSAIVHPEAQVGPHAVLGEHVVIGPRTRVGAQVFLGDGVVTGA